MVVAEGIIIILDLYYFKYSFMVIFIINFISVNFKECHFIFDLTNFEKHNFIFLVNLNNYSDLKMKHFFISRQN